MARIADQVPGFGGVFFDEAGDMVAQLKDPGRLEEAKPHLLDFVFRQTESPQVRQHLAAAVAGMRAQSVEYDFRELYGWRDAVRSLLTTSPEITMIDIDERRNRLVIGVGSDADIPNLRQKVAALAVPEAALVVQRAGPFTLNATLWDVVRPVIAGVQVETEGTCLGGFCICTLGYNVRRKLPSGAWDSGWYLSTASHCTPEFAQATSRPVGQPTLSSLIGTEFLDPPTFTKAQDPACPVGGNCRRSDFAVIQYTTANLSFGKLAWPNLGSTTITATRWVTGVYPPFVGVPIQMVGRTSGRSSGEVQVECADIYFGQVDVWLICQGRGSYATAGGDSGGPVVRETGVPDEVWSVGSVVGRDQATGQAVFSTTSEFLAELEATGTGTYYLDISAYPPPVVSISGHTFLPPGVSCTWTANVAGGVPPYSIEWSGLFSGSGSTITGVTSSSGWLFVTVTDRPGHTAEDSIFITVDPNAPAPADCNE